LFSHVFACALRALGPRAHAQSRIGARCARCAARAAAACSRHARALLQGAAAAAGSGANAEVARAAPLQKHNIDYVIHGDDPCLLPVRMRAAALQRCFAERCTARAMRVCACVHASSPQRRAR
jgi:hypothetical protein